MSVMRNCSTIPAGVFTDPSSPPSSSYSKLVIADEYFDYWGYPAQGRWKIYGLQLPDQVLEKVYHLNAEGIFRQFRGMADLQTEQNETRVAQSSFFRDRNMSSFSAHDWTRAEHRLPVRREKAYSAASPSLEHQSLIK